ncbi:MAG: Gfo/Idh/MocA family oxidoreductase [Lachnospiraceae bacterium]|jgi:predicted dehydrogenase|nr:Gfo/Idh/MocA family oxidoreductase [Lachnospiraceae bacterium]
MKLGIMGHGPIVYGFLDAVSRVEHVTAAAIYNRPSSATEGAALAEKFGIPVTYNDFDAFLADSRIDTVYVALPNSLHYEYALKILQAGKNAIVEKPFTATAAQAIKLANTAREKNLFVFEAITVSYLPHTKKVKELLPRIGDISLVQCNYSQYSSRYDQLMNGELTNMFDPRFAGGCLMDINSYNVHFVTEIFGEPEFIRYFPRMGVSGVDVSGVAVLQYSDFAASCVGAKDSASRSFGVIQGRYGNLVLEGPVSRSDSLTLEIRGEEPEHFDVQGCRLDYELAEMERIISCGDREAFERHLEHSLLVARLLEEARESAGITFACDMEEAE